MPRSRTARGAIVKAAAKKSTPGVKPLPSSISKLRGARPEEIVALLGVIPDCQVAAWSGLSERAVWKARLRRGLARPPEEARRKPFLWTPQRDALLGTAWDSVVARRLGTTFAAVAARRSKLGIPAFKAAHPGSILWSPEAIRLLGTMPDTELGRRLGVSSVTVHLKRKKLSIPPFVPRRTVWPPWAVRLLGNITDERLARRLKVTIGTVGRERRRRRIPPRVPPAEALEWTKARIALLGQAPDKAVAAELGLHYSTVARKRKNLGIPSYYPRTSEPLESFPWTKATLALLGTMPDASLARRLKTKRTIVQNKRRSLQIEPFWKHGRPIIWTPAMLRLLGTMPDMRVARALGISLGVVRRRREIEGVPPYTDRRRPRPRRWDR